MTAFNNAGETHNFSSSELGYSAMKLAGISSNVKVATATATSLVGHWTVTAVSGGTCTINVRDQYANSTPIKSP